MTWYELKHKYGNRFEIVYILKEGREKIYLQDKKYDINFFEFKIEHPYLHTNIKKCDEIIREYLINRRENIIDQIIINKTTI